MLTPSEALLIADLFYTLDKQVRHDLSLGKIADERDCVARLVGSFSYPFGIFNQYGFHHLRFRSKWFARVNSSGHEQWFGCDSMLVFRVDNQLKVGLFEAKWPRILNDPHHCWDYPQKSTKLSHFTNQIRRQAAWTSQAAIWETFFFEAPVNTAHPPFDLHGATCVRHDVARQLVDEQPDLETLWDNADLQTLIQRAQGSSAIGKQMTNLRQMVLDMLTCEFGEAIDIEPDSRRFVLTSISPALTPERAYCPILTFSGDDNNSPAFIEDFMASNGLTFFQQVDIIRSQ